MINKYMLLYLFSVFIASLSQIMLKVSAERSYKNKFDEYYNRYVIGAYSMLFMSTLLTVLSLKGIPLNIAPVLEASGYIYMGILARLFLKEKISKRKILGIVLIVFGMLVFNFPWK